MKRFLKNYRLSENIEVLFMLVIGIVLQMTDGSPFSLEQRWLMVWETELPSQYFILSIIVVVRCLTTYVYVVSAMLVICSIVKNTSSKLMLLWLLIAAIKSVFMTFLEALTGVYVCSAFGKIRKACIEFFISKSLEIIFAAYLWASVLNIYQEMERKADMKKPETWEQLFVQKMNNGRQRTRSLLDQSTLHKTACLNYFEFKDVPQIILQMLRREEEMSEDSLLGPGMMLASVSNLGSFDNLKTSQSLGELGLVNLNSTQVMGLEDDEMLSPPEKALKFLRLTWSDVKRTQRNKKAVGSEVYAVDDDTWNKLTAKGATLNKPKQPRAEIFLKQIPWLGKGSEENIRNKNATKALELKFGWSLINFFQEQDTESHSTIDEQDEEILSVAYNQEESDDYDNEAPLFMSNIRDEIVVNRIRLDFVSRAAKGNAYANLYKQDYMSVIGPEVFERASKLPKVISFSKYHAKMGMKRSSSLPTFSPGKCKRKITFEEEFMNKEEINSKSDLRIEQIRENSNESLILESRNCESERQTSVESPIESQDVSCQESIQNLPCQENSNETSNSKSKAGDEVLEEPKQSTTGEFLLKYISDKLKKKNCPEPTEPDDSRQQKIPCFKNRRIKIKRIGRRIKVQLASDTSFTGDKTPSNEVENDSESCSASKTVSESVSKNCLQDHSEFDSKTLGKDDSHQRGYDAGNKKESFTTNSNQLFFFTKPIQQRLTDVLITHDDSNSKINPYRNLDDLLRIQDSQVQDASFRTYRTLRERQNVVDVFPFEDNINTKVWKSKVFKTLTADHSLRTDSSHRSFQDEYIINHFKRKIAMEMILAHTYRDLLAEKLYKAWDGCDILEEDKKSEDSISERDRDDFIVKSFVFLDSSDSEESVENRSICKTKNPREDSLLLKTSSISMLSDVSEKCESCSDLKNIISGKSSNSHVTLSNDDGAALGLDPNRPQLIRNWLNSSFTEETDIQNRNCGSAVVSETVLCREDLEKHDNETSVEELTEPVETNKRKGLINLSEIVNNSPDQDSFCSQDSDEPFSLYYSKAADLASPLLDMRRFIYPDHIHYSYKHVKKKGFDVDISGGLPLIVRESLTMNHPVKMENVSASHDPEIGITRKPMDLSFAMTDAFTEWQTSDKNPVVSELDGLAKDSSEIFKDHSKKGNTPGKSISGKKIKKRKQSKRSEGIDQSHRSEKSEDNKKSKSQPRNGTNSKHFYSIKDYLLLQRLLKMYRRKINMEVKKSLNFRKERSPTQISSTQLHSNKGRINSTYNPAISLHENKTRTEKKKMETQEERTKVMLARLEREVILQNNNKNANKTFGPLRHI